MTKTITIGLVSIAFVAGSIFTGTMVYAAGDNNGQPFEALWDAIHNIELTPGPQGEPGPAGESRNFANYHTTQGNAISGAGTTIVQQSFTTTSNSAIIFLTGNVHYISVEPTFLFVDVFVDGQKELTSLAADQGPVTLNQFNDFSWTGTVPSGTHDIEVKIATKQGGTNSPLVCGISEFPEHCQLNTLVID